MRYTLFLLWSSFLFITASKAVSSVQPISSVSFYEQDGTERRLRLPREADFSDKLITKNLPPEEQQRYKNCLRNNEAGLLAVESLEGEIIGRIDLFRMALGYQPWPVMTKDDQTRSSIILSFYNALLDTMKIPLNPSKKVRKETNMELLHLNPNITALKIMNFIQGQDGEQFSTISLQEAVARLVGSNKMKVSDPGITVEPISPSLFISITQRDGFKSTDQTKVYLNLPYYPADSYKKGLFHALVTPISEGVNLPDNDSWQIKDYSDF